jgi:hypothetical protein
LERFEDKFKEPTGLTPRRPEDVEIKLTTDLVPRQRGIGILSIEDLTQLKKQLQ